MTRHVELRPGAYHDSVTLMQVSRTVATEPGVVSALVAMATELNLDLLTGMGFDRPDGAGPGDLLVGIEASDDDALTRALARLEAALTDRTPSGSGPAAGAGAEPAPRTVGTAARRAGATVALISTPGPHAFTEAMDALHSDLHVVVFSDNVPVEQEVRLKQEAREHALLVMGPDCGTAVVGGVGFGFANVVRPGPVGIVAASGTGAQQLMSLVDGAGVGISHCLGVGGRDLSSVVGGASTLAALDLLADDEATEVIVVVSKPPAPEVAEAVRLRADKLDKPVVRALLGPGEPDLTAVAETVVTAAGAPWRPPRWWPAPVPRTGSYPTVRGLFAGGTLCDEAMLIASAALGPVRSNIPLRPSWVLEPDLSGSGHQMIDFGDDTLTQGRPHPMIDNSLRIERLFVEAADPTCGVVLLDVVLGHAAHPDPAAELAPAIVRARNLAGARGRDLAVVVALIGTADDPQDLPRQAKALREAGASVHLSNAHAARTAVDLVRGTDD
ncbi:FdrA family protein [Jiangella asiatica]|uniref:FdrA family protein n=1 Tax=Jiangella asiatica TaxID=2530372 RepID=A0A4R5CJ80_9ACTN|nr:FdrA family protein [Jiangella asiatica]TDE00282.1 FdrA family protein [Jiangella asiatica]